MNRERRKRLHAAYGDHPPCFACVILRDEGIDTGCDGAADDGHELLSRARAGSTDANLLDVDGIIPVGRACHRWIDEHPNDAERLGLARKQAGD